MLSKYDIMWMEDTIREVIREWDTRIKIYSRLPLEHQPNYNHLMREFIGDSYCSFIEIDAERKDLVNNMTNDPDIYDMYRGKKNDGTLLFAIPSVYDDKQYKPSLHDLITINGDDNVYCIRSMRDRIGETLITMIRMTGNTPKITEVYKTDDDGNVVVDEDGNNVIDHIIIKDYNWNEEVIIEDDETEDDYEDGDDIDGGD